MARSVRRIDYNEDRKTVTRREVFDKPMTLLDLMQWADKQGMLAKDINFSAGIFARWESLETDEERDNRLEWNHRHDERQAKFERDLYERLKVKFEVEDEL